MQKVNKQSFSSLKATITSFTSYFADNKLKNLCKVKGCERIWNTEFSFQRHACDKFWKFVVSARSLIAISGKEQAEL